jgi:hypothetical protein
VAGDPDELLTIEEVITELRVPPLGEPYAEFSGWQASRAEPELAPVRR